jgi:hypothetical protein
MFDFLISHFNRVHVIFEGARLTCRFPNDDGRFQPVAFQAGRAGLAVLRRRFNRQQDIIPFTLLSFYTSHHNYLSAP